MSKNTQSSWFSKILAVFSGRDTDLIQADNLPRFGGKKTLDINTCSKDEMVKILGLPIVYANHIESLQNEGYIFTHLEELSEIAGIPESYLPKIAPLINFSYDEKLENYLSWRRVNTFSQEQLIELGLSMEVAQKIVKERHKNGGYQSVMDIKKRTGFPFHVYRQIVP